MSSTSASQTVIRFGVYELDVQTGVLRKNGMRIRCQDQPLQVLAALLERPGELISREELRRRVWPQDTFVDFDHALNTAIKKIRAALNDDADSPRYIETIPRRGYRFIGPVEPRLPQNGSTPAAAVVAANGNGATPEATPSAAPVPRYQYWPLLLGATVVVLLLAFLLLWRRGVWRSVDSSSHPQFERLTIDTPHIGGARFTPDGMSVTYSAGALPNAQAYLRPIQSEGPQALDISGYAILSVSRTGEMAVLANHPESGMELTGRSVAGTLARVPLGGGAPRDILQNVEAADFSPSGDLAVVRHVGQKSRLEFPIGNVLYETTGWISSPRFSPTGDQIAFLDHPIVPDDRGTVSIADRSGNRRVLSEFWESERGLAWNPRGDEVWFAATAAGLNRELYAVDLGGHLRRILGVPGGITLYDISRDGRVLLTRDNERLGIFFMGPGEKEPRELSWKDWSVVTDISSDGKRLLFDEEGENSGPSYRVGYRPTDGSPPVILGSGYSQSLSPDGQWALSIVPPPNNQLVVLPTGAGNPKVLDHGTIQQYRHGKANWFADSRRIVFTAYEEGHGTRCYVQSIDGGKPRPFTPDGMDICSVAPNGSIFAKAEGSRALIYASETDQQPREIRIEHDDYPVNWSPDSKFIYLVHGMTTPPTIDRFEIATGRRQPWKQIDIQPLGSGFKTSEIVITPDGQFYAYTYSHNASDLYLVQGLR